MPTVAPNLKQTLQNLNPDDYILVNGINLRVGDLLQTLSQANDPQLSDIPQIPVSTGAVTLLTSSGVVDPNAVPIVADSSQDL
jgi:hypothetical protein